MRRNSFRFALSDGVSSPWAKAVDHAEDPLSVQTSPSNTRGVGRSAENEAYFGAVLYRRQDVYGIGVPQVDTEHVAGADGFQRFMHALDQVVVVSFRPDKTGARGPVKATPNFACGTVVAMISIEIFRGLDKVGSAEDDIAPFRECQPSP